MTGSTDEPTQVWFHHAGVSVGDMDQAIAWYSRVLNFSLERRYQLSHVPVEIAVLRNGPLHIELLRREGSVPAHPDRHDPDSDLLTQGNKHIAFSVSNVRAVAAQLAERGAEVAWVKDFPGGRAGAFIRDCEGNLIELVQFPPIEATACL